MDIVIEDGFHTSYISSLLIALFYKKSMIERSFILENNDLLKKGLYLQQIIFKNFIEPIRNNVCISSKMLNEIRLCSIAFGWKLDKSFDKMFDNFDILEYMNFLIELCQIHPIHYINNGCDMNCSISVNDDINYFPQSVIELQQNQTIQLSYNLWAVRYRIVNVPNFVVFKINNLSSEFSINKKIKLFDDTHQFHNVLWVFHSLIYEIDKYDYHVIVNNDKNMVMYQNNSYPNIHEFNEKCIQNLKNKSIIIFYAKEPTV
jgi:hypothetical protein